MGARTAVMLALAIILAMTGPMAPAMAQPASPEPVSSSAQPGHRMFSPWYAEALRGILDLEEADGERLEQRVANDPEDSPARLQLMAYHQRADRSGHPEDRAKRAQHALWLIEHHPGSELLRSPVSRFSQGELTTSEYERAVRLWSSAADASPGDAEMQWNAASFFQDLDASLHLRYLEAAVAAGPEHPFAIRPLAHLYARLLLEGGPLAPRAQAGLEASRNVWVLGNAAHVLQGLYNRSVQTGRPDPRAAELAERYFLRAKALDPGLDRQAILPQLDMRAAADARDAGMEASRNWRALAEENHGRMQRLPVEAFPELPPAVAGVLRARGCTIPQPSPGGVRRNVIRGEFFAKGETGWAALCSVNRSTHLLVFRNDQDTNPQTISTSDDLGYMQDLGGGKVGYSRGITAVGRDFIVRHYRAYGGPEPPPIDHHGIDDAFLGKASITWYFHQGQWLRLTGAD